MPKKEMPRKNTLNQKILDGEISIDDVNAAKPNSNTGKTTVASRKNKDNTTFGIKGRPTNAQLRLLERYKVDNMKDVVANTIDGVIIESLPQIKQAIENMMEYGDPKVFKVLPKELDETMRDYGMAAQEYFGKNSKTIDGMPVFIVPASYHKCSKCGKYKSEIHFYKSYSDTTNGLTHVCRDCCNELFTSYVDLYGVREALILMCQKIDAVVYTPMVEKYTTYFSTSDGKIEILKGTFFGNFINDQNISIMRQDLPREDCVFSKTNFSGEPFKEITAKCGFLPVYDDKFISKDSDEDVDEFDSAKSIVALKKKWGEFDPPTLRMLDDKYNEWYDQCEIDGLSREKLVMQLCYEEIDIIKTRENGLPVKDKIKNFQNLMKEADLTPKKQVASSSNSQFASLSEFVKHAEKNKPIINKNPFFEDVDGVERLWKSIAGAICRTIGRDNEYVANFKDNYKEYTVDIFNHDNDSSDGDSDEETTE